MGVGTVLTSLTVTLLEAPTDVELVPRSKRIQRRRPARSLAPTHLTAPKTVTLVAWETATLAPRVGVSHWPCARRCCIASSMCCSWTFSHCPCARRCIAGSMKRPMRTQARRHHTLAFTLAEEVWRHRKPTTHHHSLAFVLTKESHVIWIVGYW